jgi:hypothetical protein
LRLISAMHIIRSCFKTSSLWPASYKDGLFAVSPLPEMQFLCLYTAQFSVVCGAENFSPWETFLFCTQYIPDTLRMNCFRCLVNISSPEISFFTRS